VGKLKVEVYQNEYCEKNGGVVLRFTNSRGVSAATWFNNPSSSISHVHREYLQGRLHNVCREVQVEFIKKEYKEQIKPFYKED
jgi:hypothetical protein